MTRRPPGAIIVRHHGAISTGQMPQFSSVCVRQNIPLDSGSMSIFFFMPVFGSAAPETSTPFSSSSIFTGSLSGS